MKKNEQQIDNSYLRYANCWEDADILIEGLDLQKGDSILSIGSGGDNSFSLLINNPEIIVAVDINPNQLKLIELKKAAYKVFNHQEFISFLGFVEVNNRIELYAKVKPFLNKEDQEYWQERIVEIEEGIIHQGKFEKYFKTFRDKVLSKVHSNKKVDQLFEKKTPKRQEIFFYNKWNTWRWRLLFKVFFSKYVMGKFGRDPKFLKQVAVPVSSFILDKAATHLGSTYSQSNYFLEYILTGKFSINLPHYVRKENFDSIKNNIEKLVVFEGFAQDAFKKHKGFNKFNLSNIYEYLEPKIFETVVQNMMEHCKDNSTFCYWNLMVDRKMSEVNSSLIYQKDKSKELQIKDKGFFYKNFIIETK
jgi:S-adenosylmethionine-diacylglycerol 3-amino-3-carboxypropyl transferase